MTAAMEFKLKVLAPLRPRQVARVLETWVAFQATAVLALTEPPERLASILSYLPEEYRLYALEHLAPETVWRAYTFLPSGDFDRMADCASLVRWGEIYGAYYVAREKQAQVEFLAALASGDAHGVSTCWASLSLKQRGVAAFHMTDDQIDQFQKVLK